MQTGIDTLVSMNENDCTIIANVKDETGVQALSSLMSLKARVNTVLYSAKRVVLI